MSSCAVLHVTSLLGGGVDRHVRDIARAVPRRHLVWHAGDRADVIEVPDEARFIPLDGAALEANPGPLEEWLRAREVGLVHAHSVGAATMRRAGWARSALGLKAVVTLHDVLFLRPDAFEAGAGVQPDRRWLDRTSDFLRAAAAVLAPSAFIAELAMRHIPGLEVQVVPNGSPQRLAATSRRGAHPEFERRRPRHVLGVLGAIGKHKGSELLEALAHRLDGTGIGIVIVGYLENQLLPGWRVPGQLFVHGAYEDEEVPALLAAYGAEVALFPNRVPESFSYALSDVWAAGLPVLAAPQGALRERVSRHGGGWLLPEGFGVDEVAARVRELLSPAGLEEVARVKSLLARPDPGRIPSLQSMADSLEALYARCGIAPFSAVQAGGAALQALLAHQLDGSIFRREMIRMVEEIAQARREREELRVALDHATRFEAEARPWIAKLEADIRSLQADVRREVDARRALDEQNRGLRAEKAAFDLLPGIVRRWLLKKSRNAGS